VRPAGTVKPLFAWAIQSARFRTGCWLAAGFAATTTAANIRIVIRRIISEQFKQMSYKSVTLL
jgi:hypothetical protein